MTSPFGRKPLGPNDPYAQSHPGFWERMQDHYNDDPVWDGTTDSLTTAAVAPPNVVNTKTLIRVARLPMAVGMSIVLTASSAGAEQNPPAPFPAIPWFIVTCGGTGARFRYSCFSGVEIVGGTGLTVECINIPWLGGAAAPLFVEARSWITMSPPAMNVVAVL